MPKKTVVVGLGGTGDWVLTFLKNRLFTAYGEEQVKRDVQFLLVDTIHAKTREEAFEGDKKFRVKGAVDQHEEEVAHLGGVRVENHEYLPLTGEIRQVADSVRRGQDAHTRHLSWFQADYYLRALPAAAMNITDGAGQWRQFGRIALSLSIERGEFVRRIEKLIEASKVPSGDTLMFYLVSSLAGGTGAGTVLDTAALVREVAQRAGVKVWVVGFLVLPSAFRNVLGATSMSATETRSFAAYRELVRFQTQSGQGVPLSLAYSLNHRFEVKDKLFDTVFLLDGKTQKKDLTEAPPWLGISPSIADGLEVFVDSSAGGPILEDLVNASAKMADEVRIAETLPAQFHALGSHKIVLPARQYAAIFANRFIQGFLEQVVPIDASDGIPRLQKDALTDGDLRSRAEDFARKIPNLFTQIVDLLPTRSQNVNQRLKVFAGKSLQDLRPLLLPKARLAGGETLQLLMTNPLSEVQTGKDTGDSAEDAASRLMRECERRLSDHWEKLETALALASHQVEAEITAEVEHQAGLLLNGQVEELSQFPLGSTHAFLQQLHLIAEDLERKVLRKVEEEIDRRDGGDGSVGAWQQRVTTAQTTMEDTRGLDSWLNRSRAWEAQKKYLELQVAFLERRKVSKVYETFYRMVAALRDAARGLNQRIEEWAGKARSDEEYSAWSTANREVALLEAGLRRAGQSFTSSYGLHAYERDRPVDITMGGYRDVLYSRHAAPYLEPWTSDLRWQLESSNGEGEPGSAQLVLWVGNARSGGLELNPRSGSDLHQQIFDTVQEDLEPKITSLSIFDYFLEQGLTAEQVAGYFKEHACPLLGPLVSIERASAHRQIHLLAQRPKSPEAVAFLEELQNHFKGNLFDDATFQEGKKADFDNPYTLTLLYIVQDIRDGQVALMKQYEDKYYRQLLQGETYIVNHIFRCDQEAARIEKHFLEQHGRAGSGGWKQIHPRVCRLLDDPSRVRLLVRLWAMKTLRLEYFPGGAGEKVWMLLPPEVADAGDSRVVWLTAPVRESGDGRPINLSPLLAAEQFCFAGRSSKPDGQIEIDFRRLESGVSQQATDLIDRTAQKPTAELIAVYRAFLDGPLSEEGIELCRKVHTEEEAEDLGIVVRYYLESEIRRLEA